MASTPSTSGLPVAQDLGEIAHKSSSSTGGTSDMAFNDQTSILPVSPNLDEIVAMPSFSATDEMAATSPTSVLPVAPKLGETETASKKTNQIEAEVKTTTLNPSCTEDPAPEKDTQKSAIVADVDANENTAQKEIEVKTATVVPASSSTEVLALENNAQESADIVDLEATEPSSSASSNVVGLHPPGSPHPPSSDFTFENPNTQSSVPASLMPIYATHYPTSHHFQICPVTVDLTSEYWNLAMEMCNYSEASIKQGHYFCKTVAYHPTLHLRTITKYEYRLVPPSLATAFESGSLPSSAPIDADPKLAARRSARLCVRPRWFVVLYYGGPPKEPWNEVVPAWWRGEELDVAVAYQHGFIGKILEVIALAGSEDVRADPGEQVCITTKEQIWIGHEPKGGHGGNFRAVMGVLGEAVEGLEGVLREVDAGAGRDWEAERR